MSEENSISRFEEWVDMRLREVAESVVKTEQRAIQYEKQVVNLRSQIVSLRGSLAGLNEAKKQFLSEVWLG